MINNNHKTKAKYPSSHPKVQNNPIIKAIIQKWEKATPPLEPTKWPLPHNRWEEVLQHHPDKQTTAQFLTELKTGFKTTENKNIKTEKNTMEYKNTIEEWVTIYQTMEKRIGQKCAWGPFTETQIPQQYQEYHRKQTFILKHQ